MHRFFVDAPLLAADVITLGGEAFHHLSVVRLRVGEEILLLDGLGLICRARLSALGRCEARAEVLERWRESEALLPLRLIQGLPKGERFEWLLEKGVELGISAFTPVRSARSQVRGEKHVRWERVVQEAARQSRRPLLPRLDPLTPLATALAQATEELRLMLWEEGSVPLNAALPAAAPADCVLLVGPEGGFTVQEAQLASQFGFVPVSLGRRILRTETAGMAVAAVLQNRYGDFGTLESPGAGA